MLRGMELPVDERLRWILRRSATLLSYGAEPVRGLVTPTADFFPDAFDRSPASIGRLLTRIQGHAGLKGVDLSLAIVTPEGEAVSASSCSTGACNAKGLASDSKMRRLERRRDGSYVASIAATEVGHPSILTTALVRAVSAVFVAEAGVAEDLSRGELEPIIDLASIWLGFGVLATNGSYVYLKGCGGVSVLSATRMPTDELAMGLAVFCAAFADLPGCSDRIAAKHLDPTPREHFAAAVEWARSNRRVIGQLRDDPALIEQDTFTLRAREGWVGRVLGLVKRRGDALPSSDDLASLESSIAAAKGGRALPPASGDEARRKRLAEIRALVDESFD